MGGDWHPDEGQNERKNLKQLLHSVDKYLNKAFGTTANCLVVRKI